MATSPSDDHAYQRGQGAPMPPCAVCGISWWQHDEPADDGRSAR